MADNPRQQPEPKKGEAGADVPVQDKSALTVIDAIRAFRITAEDAKQDRLRKNKINRDVYLGRQDWSHKMDGQSTEFLPKVATAVEQMSAFVKKGLIQFGDWFSVTLDRALDGIIDGTQVRSVMMPFLDNLWTRNNTTVALPTIIADAVKVALLESLIILKVHGGMQKTRKFKFEKKLEEGEETRKLQTEDDEEWRLRIDIVRPEDYYPDPTGNGLFEIQRCERDLHEVIAGAEEGMYDKAAVDMLIDIDYKRPMDEERSAEAINQLDHTSPAFRKRVVLDEFWGTILNEDGTVAHRNVVATVANDKILIRKPEPNPFWHQESPFVVTPLIRVPFSVWHKALYDHASDLNISINEMFNLMLDGGLSAVWGVKQIRLEDLEDPSQVSGGVKQGMTLAVKQTLPHNGKVLETVSTGNVPTDAMAVFEALQREFTQAALTNELKLGQMPPKRVLATEVVEASQSQAVTLDGIVADIEVSMVVLLRKAWLTILQNADSLPPSALPAVIDKRVAVLLTKASPEERFALFAGKSQFKAHGLSDTMARAQDFQKLMALMQAVTQNAMLFQAFMFRFSPEKTLRKIFRTLNINAGDIEKDQDELAEAAEEMQRTQEAAGIMGGGQGGSPETPGKAGASAPGAQVGGAPVGGGSGLPAEINQLNKPALVPNA